MPAYTDEGAGKIIREMAFALGKMHDSSEWAGLIRNKGIPSDIDLAFDNNGQLLYMDFSICFTRWDADETLIGQRWLYKSAIRDGRHCAAMLKHSVTPEMNRPIKTLSDVESFHLMFWDHELVFSQVYHGSEKWKDFVMRWMNTPEGPLQLRRRILGLSVGLVLPSARDKTNGQGSP